MAMKVQEVEEEALVELPQRLETSAFWSPVSANLTQAALALNAADLGGSQTAMAHNIGGIFVSVG